LLSLGAFTALAINTAGVNIIIAAPIAIIFAACFYGWGQNRILWRSLRRRKTGLIAGMIVSIGLAIFLRYTLVLFFGGFTPKLQAVCRPAWDRARTIQYDS